MHVCMYVCMYVCTHMHKYVQGWVSPDYGQVHVVPLFLQIVESAVNMVVISLHVAQPLQNHNCIMCVCVCVYVCMCVFMYCRSL
jgi:hypothetical protein